MTPGPTSPGPRRVIEYQPLDDVRPAERNAKKHDQPALIRSIETCGYTQPVLVDERTGHRAAPARGRGEQPGGRAALARPAPPAGAVAAHDRVVAASRPVPDSTHVGKETPDSPQIQANAPNIG